MVLREPYVYCYFLRHDAVLSLASAYIRPLINDSDPVLPCQGGLVSVKGKTYSSIV